MTAKTDAELNEGEPQATAQSHTPTTPGARLAARQAAKAARKAAERGKTDVVTDAVQQQALSAGSWVSDHGRTIGVAVATVAVLGIGLIAYQYNAQSTAAAAAGALGNGVKATLAAVGSAADLPEDAPDEEIYATLDARTNKALAGYREVVSKHAGTTAAIWARLGEGNELLNLGKADDAARAFGAVFAATEDDFLRYRALEGHGFALEAQNKLDDATQKFVEIGKLANGAYKPASDYHLARLLAVRGDAKGAREMFGKLIESLGEQALNQQTSNQRVRFAAIKDEAEMRLTELGGERKTRPTSSASGIGAEGLTPELLETLRKQLKMNTPTAPEGQ